MNHESTTSIPDVDPTSLRFRERVRQRTGSTELLVFRIGREQFGVELKAVDEVVESPDVRAIPESPPGLLGVFAFRERLLPLYSPSTVLGPTVGDSVIALVMRWGQRRLALAVDDADDVMHVELAELRDPPHIHRDDEIVAAVLWRGGQLITVLDARALVTACANITMPSAA